MESLGGFLPRERRIWSWLIADVVISNLDRRGVYPGRGIMAYNGICTTSRASRSNDSPCRLMLGKAIVFDFIGHASMDACSVPSRQPV